MIYFTELKIMSSLPAVNPPLAVTQSKQRGRRLNNSRAAQPAPFETLRHSKQKQMFEQQSCAEVVLQTVD